MGEELHDRPRPWTCPDHPDAPVKRTWREHHVRWPNGRVGQGAIDITDVEHHCNECGRRLADGGDDA